MTQGKPLVERLRRFGVTHTLRRNLIAEFMGTFLLVFIGTCIVAQFHLGGGHTTTWIGVNIGWGFAIMFSVMATARTSGGHLNPAVSLLLWSLGHLPFTWVLLYSIAQTAGAFTGSMVMYAYYKDAFDVYDGGLRSVLGATGSGAVFCSYPSHMMQGMLMPYIDQIAGTGVLAFFLCVVVDERNKIPKIWHPMFFGFLVMLIGTGFGMNMGYPINPARDLGPRLFSLFIYGTEAFTAPYPSYFLAPIFGALIGALVGGWLYQITLGIHNPDDEEIEPNSTEQQMKLLA